MTRISPSAVVLGACLGLILGCGKLQELTGNTSASQDTFSSGDDGASGDGGGEIEAGTVRKATPPSTAQKLMAAGTDNSMAWPGTGLSRGQCSSISDGGDVKGPDCITDVIECGQTIIGHTRGGTNNFDTRFWERNFCTPATTDHDGGGERVYKFSFPDDGEWRVWFTLDTPCADLDLFTFDWDGSTCPSAKTNVNECDAKVQDGTKRERAEGISQGNWPNWLVVVEGKDDEEGAFALTAQCRRGLR